LIILPLTHSTLNVMSLMGVLMLVGIADSNSILIVDFAHNLESQGMSPTGAVISACRVRLRPILMTSLATIIGMIPMAMKLGTGAERRKGRLRATGEHPGPQCSAGLRTGRGAPARRAGRRSDRLGSSSSSG